MAKKFYAVAVGRAPGIYTLWLDCERNVKGFTGNKYKSFATEQQAREYVSNATGFPMKGETKQLDILEGRKTFETKGPKTVSKLIHSREPVFQSKLQKIQLTKSNQLENASRPPSKRSASDEGLPDAKRTASEYPPTSTYQVSSKTFLSKRTEPAERVVIFTDGACRGNGKSSNAASGLGVYYGPNDDRNKAIPFDSARYGEPTNQKAELLAALTALEDILTDLGKGNKTSFTICTDSRYTIDSITNWSDKHVRNGWKNAAGKEVKNKEIIQGCLERYNRANEMAARLGVGSVSFEYVKGHAGHEGNEMADRLANEGADRYR